MKPGRTNKGRGASPFPSGGDMMDMKRKLEIMKHIEQANKKHMEDWKGEQNMNTNTAFVAEQKPGLPMAT